MNRLSVSKKSVSAPIERFNKLLDSSYEKTKSKIIVALDIPHRKETGNLLRDSVKLIESVSDFVCGVKINYHLLIPLSLQEILELNNLVHADGLVSIADIKLNDIDSTDEVATDYLWDSGFDAVIVNPFVGYKGALGRVYEKAHKLGKGVISLAYMSHPGADEGYGLELKNGSSVFDLLLERANSWGSDGVIIGTTQTERIRIARSVLKKEIRIISPGSGAQGGDAKAAIEAGADYLIFGRSIISDADPRKAARQIFETMKLPSRGMN